MKYVKSKGAERRRYPKFTPGMSTYNYVHAYFQANAWQRTQPPIKREGGPYGPVDVDALFMPLNQAPATLYDPATPEVLEEA